MSLLAFVKRLAARATSSGSTPSQATSNETPVDPSTYHSWTSGSGVHYVSSRNESSEASVALVVMWPR